jgi:hypothetical protein
MARVAASSGDTQAAVRLLGAAETLRRRIGSVLSPAERSEHDRLLATLRTALGDEAFAAITSEGRAQPLAATLALVTSIAGALHGTSAEVSQRA